MSAMSDAHDSLAGRRVYVAGHAGMVGSALVRRLQAASGAEIVTARRSDLDLCDADRLAEFLGDIKPDIVLVAAARVGGIKANDSQPAQFIRDNLAIATNLVHESWRAGISRLLFLGSSCIYPRLAPQPMNEEALLTGVLEPTNEPYAIAKIAGIKLCESYNRQYGTDFRSVMPTNLYGPHDNFDLETSHVLPALIRKFHDGRVARTDSVEVWGTGKPRREFLHVDDLADACVFLASITAERYATVTEPMRSHINVGTGIDVSIAELAQMVARAVGYTGEVRFNTDYPDGTPRKLLDISRLEQLGWRPAIELEAGIASTYAWYREFAEAA